MHFASSHASIKYDSFRPSGMPSTVYINVAYGVGVDSVGVDVRRFGLHWLVLP